MVKAIGRIGQGVLVVVAALLAVPGAAQTSEQAPQPALPSPVPTVAIPAPTPSATIAPSPTPTPSPTTTPTPRATVTPTPTPTTRPAVRPGATLTPRATPTTSASPAAAVVPSPTSIPTPAPWDAASPAPVATAAPAERDPATAPLDWKPWAAGGAALVLLVLLWLRYQRETPRPPIARESEHATEPEATTGSPAPPLASRTSDPWLTVTVRPVRAGLNMVTAVADCEITLANEGGGPAEAVRIALGLLAAHAGQQAKIAEANAGPIVRPVVPAFTLRSGETRTVRGVASAHLAELPTMQAGGRDMLVPLVLVNVQHRDPDGVEHRTSQGFVVGVERVDSHKLAPFWLDTIRMTEHVAARPSGAPERRRLA